MIGDENDYLPEGQEPENGETAGNQIAALQAENADLKVRTTRAHPQSTPLPHQAVPSARRGTCARCRWRANLRGRYNLCAARGLPS